MSTKAEVTITYRDPLCRRYIAGGAISAAIAVALGALGTHSLRPLLSVEMLAVFETGVRYQMYHAGGMIAAGLAEGLLPVVQIRRLRTACRAFGTGTIIFSGSLYALALSGVPWFGAITPVGGLLFMAGWIMLALACVAPKAG